MKSKSTETKGTAAKLDKAITNVFFAAAIVLYLFTRFIKIEDFPIYFFCDEAVQAVRAEELLNNGLKDELGRFIPPLINAFGKYELGTTVYLNLLTLPLLGKKIWVTRGITVIFSLLGSIFTTLLLKETFKLKNYWVGILYLSAIPLFFIHSRTGFTTVTATSFYAGFLYFYFLYRTRKTLLLLPSILFAALSAYSYPGIWLVIIGTIILFSLFDISYHFKQLKTVLAGLIFAFLLFLPLIHFQVTTPNITSYLQAYDTALIKDLPIKEKIVNLFSNYFLAIKPQFLFFVHPSYHVRHYLKGYGYFPSWSLPLIVLGFLYLLASLKKPAYRILLVALLTSPLGGVLVEPGATRIMPMVITLGLLFGLGVKVIELGLAKFSWSVKILFSLILFTTISFLSLHMTWDALTNGPLWFQDYGLYGMQYGAKQLFAEVDKSLDTYEKAVIDPSWANGPEIFIPFFLSPEKAKRTSYGNLANYLEKGYNLTNTIFFETPASFNNLARNRHFDKIHILKIIPAPNGKPAFYKLAL